MKVLDKPMERAELQSSSEFLLDDEMVKGVVDVEKGLLAVDAEMHSDLEKLLLEQGSKQTALWGINLYLDEDEIEDLLEFDSLINIRPAQQNRDRYVNDPEIRAKIQKVVEKWVK